MFFYISVCMYVWLSVCIWLMIFIGRAVDARELFDAIVSRIDALVGGDGGGGGHGGDEL
jgi:hypothetical protein